MDCDCDCDCDCGPEARGGSGSGGGETRDTKPSPDLVFRDSALGLGQARPAIKRLRTAHEMLQAGHSTAGPGPVGSGVGQRQQAAVVRPRGS